MTYCEFDRPTRRPSWHMLRHAPYLAMLAVRRLARLVKLGVTMDLRSDRFGMTLPGRAVLLSMLMKTAWLVPVIVGACALISYRHTHLPRHATAELASISLAYSERVSFQSADRVNLSAIWIPAIRARDVIHRADEVLTQKRAAVVLVHDHGQDSGQLLAFSGRLHEMGMHVLLLDTRGRGHSGTAAQTFGQLERLDVAAAVDYLAARPTVDPERIAIWGVGAGALAAEKADASISPALVIHQEVEQPARERDVDVRFLPEHWAYDPFRPVCRWSYELLWAGGPAPEPNRRALRHVTIGHGEEARAFELLRSLASDRLVAGSRE